jgi:hypothetical protein
MEQKTVRFEIKTLRDDGTFEGYASVFGVVDKGQDCVDKGAFTKTLREQPSFPLYWMHEYQLDCAAIPIGGFTAVEDRKGLLVSGFLNMVSERVGQEIYPLLKTAIVREMSIGYDTIKSAMDGAVRHLKELRLGEVSLCPAGFAMNPAAQVTAVKAGKRGSYMYNIPDFMQALEHKADALPPNFDAHALAKQQATGRKDIADALNKAVDGAVNHSSMTAEEKLAHIDGSLDQHKAAMMDWCTKCLDIAGSETGVKTMFLLREMTALRGNEPDTSTQVLEPQDEAKMRVIIGAFKP